MADYSQKLKRQKKTKAILFQLLIPITLQSQQGLTHLILDYSSTSPHHFFFLKLFLTLTSSPAAQFLIQSLKIFFRLVSGRYLIYTSLSFFTPGDYKVELQEMASRSPPDDWRWWGGDRALSQLYTIFLMKQIIILKALHLSHSIPTQNFQMLSVIPRIKFNLLCLGFKAYCKLVPSSCFQLRLPLSNYKQVTDQSLELFSNSLCGLLLLFKNVLFLIIMFPQF